MSLLTEKTIRPTLGGHEKFVFRQGWLKKGFDAALQDESIFLAENAFVTLGVGKNMAHAIRHWCLATGLLEDFAGKGLAKLVKPSTLGLHLMGPKGWDPYLEDIGSLWLIHWLLATNHNRGLAWYLVFSRYMDVEFRKLQLLNFLSKQMPQSGVNTTEGMIQRELDVFLHTYVPVQNKKGAFAEESLDCPLVDLNLLRFVAEDDIYRFNIGPKISLPAEVFGYSLMMYLRQIATNRRTVAVDECVYQPGSPGQTFKLDENSVIVYLERLEEITSGGLRLQETAGLRQIYLHDLNDDSAFKLLREYYA